MKVNPQYDHQLKLHAIKEEEFKKKLKDWEVLVVAWDEERRIQEIKKLEDKLAGLKDDT